MKHFNTTITFQGDLPAKAESIEYKMTKACANELLKMRKDAEKGWPAQKNGIHREVCLKCLLSTMKD